ncbi:MAG: amidase [Leptolyngbya sp. SIO4C1]|nr:amidase [Leptolyngbya sp. SIO4C1]
MDAVDLAFTPALEQADLIRTGQISPLDLTQLYLARIERLNPQLGSYFTVMGELAIADARAKTEQLAQLGDQLPPFFGVPISIKDLKPVEGVPCSYGLRVAKNRMAEADDGIVQQIRQAGFVILGKTATSELGSFPYTEPAGFPPARNPWHLDYTSGGSSGGAASALAAGLCAIAHGSDGGGSLRGPAFCCGLVGLKPSRGRVSHAPAGDRISGLATEGALTRTVADTAAMLDVISGYVTGDPYWLPDPPQPFLCAAQRPPGQLRIAMTTDFSPVGKADAICQQAVQSAAHRLEALGHAVEPATLQLDGLIDPFVTVWRSILDESGVPFIFLSRFNRWLQWQARFTSSGQYLKAVTALQVLSRQIVSLFEQYDVLLAPTYLHPTIRIGEWAKLRPAKTLERIIGWVAPCPPFNATGQPALSIPTGFTPEGLPLGVQLVGKPADEATLISLAAQLEADRPWTQHRPAIATP